jgi:hypothetical protein
MKKLVRIATKIEEAHEGEQSQDDENEARLWLMAVPWMECMMMVGDMRSR